MNRRARSPRKERRSLRPLVLPGVFLSGVLVGAWVFGGGTEGAEELGAEERTSLVATLLSASASPEAPVQAWSQAQGVAPVVLSDARSIAVSIHGNIPGSLRPVVGALAPALSADVTRVLAWDLDLRRDLRAGDRLEVLWVGDSAETMEVLAVRLHSAKHGRVVEGYRFRSSDDEHPSYWAPDGTEVPRRLLEEPISGYEQITSLLKDRPRHKGMDFKAPVGTPVMAPKDATVTKINWNTVPNGRCIELRYADGVLAKYLHLETTKVEAGDEVGAGDVIGTSGNTGRSTGPHLHYQLNKGTAVVDPLDYHGTTRRTLPASDLSALSRTIEALRGALSS